MEFELAQNQAQDFTDERKCILHALDAVASVVEVELHVRVSHLEVGRILPAY